MIDEQMVDLLGLPIKTKLEDKKQDILRAIGGNHIKVEEREENDFYATDPVATFLLCEKERFSTTVLEPCVGKGHIAEVLKNQGYNVICSDIIDRGYSNTEIKDFFTMSEGNKNDIITNPPYKMATEFVRKALDISCTGVKIAMFLKIQFLESEERWFLFKDHPPVYVYVLSKRLSCATGGDFTQKNASCMCYAWFVWIKGFKGEPTIRWINNE